MLNSFVKLLMTSILLFQNSVSVEEGPATEPITISGYIKQTGLNNNIPIYLKMDEGHPYAFVYIKVFVNDELVINVEEITKYISTGVYEINGFTYEDEIKNVRIEINYLEENVATSICEINLKGPSFSKHQSYYTNSFVATETNPIQIDFTFKGENANFTYIHEHVAITNNYYSSTSTRFVLFPDFSISLYNMEDKLEFCELRLFCKFEDSDLLYKYSSYTSIDLPLIEVSENKYKIIDEYRFYINNKTGMIYEKQTYECDDELLPLFIPLSLGNNITISYELHFSNLGLNYSDYIFTGQYNFYTSLIGDNTQFGSILSYKYEQIFKELEGITYA